MEPTPKQQIIELTKQAQQILIFSHTNPDGDSIGSMLALSLVLKKLGKNALAICSDPTPKTFAFLPHVETIVQNPNLGGDFIIILNTSKARVDKLGYKNYPEEHKLNIVIKPESGFLTPQDVSFDSNSTRADLIFVLDTSDLERLGAVYDQNSSLFYETPTVNIDHHSSNNHFGKINWVDLTATSTAEILVSLFEALSTLSRPDGSSGSLVDEDVATLLLTGLITDTGSFQNTNTTPKSLTIAAQMVAAGARQQEIIRNVFKTKSLSTLKLWGKILSNIQFESSGRFVWSQASRQEFLEANADDTEASGVLSELLKSVPNIDFALLLTERQGKLHGSLRGVNREVSVSDIAKLFGGGGHPMAAGFSIEGATLETHRQSILEKINAFQSQDRGAIPAPPAPVSSRLIMPY